MPTRTTQRIPRYNSNCFSFSLFFMRRISHIRLYAKRNLLALEDSVFKLFYLFILGCVGSSLLHVGFLQLRGVGATLRCGARASHCGSFSCCRAQALGTQPSVVAVCGLSSCGSRALEHRLSSCGTLAQLLRGMWDLSGPGLEPWVPCICRRILNHCASREAQKTVPLKLLST